MPKTDSMRVRPPPVNPKNMGERLPELLKRTKRVKLNEGRPVSSFRNLLQVVEQWGLENFPDSELYGEILIRAEHASSSGVVQKFLREARMKSFRVGGDFASDEDDEESAFPAVDGDNYGGGNMSVEELPHIPGQESVPTETEEENVSHGTGHRRANGSTAEVIVSRNFPLASHDTEPDYPPEGLEIDYMHNVNVMEGDDEAVADLLEA